MNLFQRALERNLRSYTQRLNCLPGRRASLSRWGADGGRWAPRHRAGSGRSDRLRTALSPPATEFHAGCGAITTRQRGCKQLAAPEAGSRPWRHSARGEPPLPADSLSQAPPGWGAGCGDAPTCLACGEGVGAERPRIPALALQLQTGTRLPRRQDLSLDSTNQGAPGGRWVLTLAL